MVQWLHSIFTHVVCHLILILSLISLHFNTSLIGIWEQRNTLLLISLIWIQNIWHIIQLNANSLLSWIFLNHKSVTRNRYIWKKILRMTSQVDLLCSSLEESVLLSSILWPRITPRLDSGVIYQQTHKTRFISEICTWSKA